MTAQHKLCVRISPPLLYLAWQRSHAFFVFVAHPTFPADAIMVSGLYVSVHVHAHVLHACTVFFFIPICFGLLFLFLLYLFSRLSVYCFMHAVSFISLVLFLLIGSTLVVLDCHT